MGAKMRNNVFLNHEKVKIIKDDILLTNEIPKESVLEVYEKDNINGHIIWKK